MATIRGAYEMRLTECSAEIERLKKIIEIQEHALRRYGPCSDHNGKVNIGGEWECQTCRAERAERQLAKARGEQP